MLDLRQKAWNFNIFTVLEVDRILFHREWQMYLQIQCCNNIFIFLTDNLFCGVSQIEQLYFTFVCVFAALWVPVAIEYLASYLFLPSWSQISSWAEGHVIIVQCIFPVVSWVSWVELVKLGARSFQPTHWHVDQVNVVHVNVVHVLFACGIKQTFCFQRWLNSGWSALSWSESKVWALSSKRLTDLG